MSTEKIPAQRPGVPMDTFSTRLRLARIHAGDISIEAAAERCGVKPATWSTWERGVHKPPHLNAIGKAIAAGLEVDEEWLLHGGPLTPDPGPVDPDGVELRAVGGSRGLPSKKRRRLVYSSGVSGSLAA